MLSSRQAILYRMVLPDHVCPFGVRAKDLLEFGRHTTRVFHQTHSLADELAKALKGGATQAAAGDRPSRRS